MNTYKPTLFGILLFMFKRFIIFLGIFSSLDILLDSFLRADYFGFLVIALSLPIPILLGILMPTTIDISKKEITVRTAVKESTFSLTDYNVSFYISDDAKATFLTNRYLILTDKHKKEISIKLVAVNNKTFTDIMNDEYLIQDLDDNSKNSIETNTGKLESFKQSIDPAKFKNPFISYLKPYLILLFFILILALIAFSSGFTIVFLYTFISIAAHIITSLVREKSRKKYLILNIEMNNESLHLETSSGSYNYKWNTINSIQLTHPDYTAFTDRTIILDIIPSVNIFYFGKGSNDKSREDYILFAKNLRKFLKDKVTYKFK